MGVTKVARPFLVTVVATALSGAGIGRIWPITPRRRSCHAGCQLRPVRRPTARSCATPTRPLTIVEAGCAMQLHHEHSCARKRAAYKTLIAAKRITPDYAAPKWWRK